jgi:hypothetical protein
LLPGRRVLAVLAVVLLSPPAFVLGQDAAPATLEVTVTDAESGSPIAGAQVRLRERATGGVTDARGVVQLAALAPGADEALVRFLGFGPVLSRVELRAGDTTRLAVQLRRVPAELAEVEVAADREPWRSLPGWEDRRRVGLGHAITRADIERIKPTRSIELMRRVPGVRLLPIGADRYVIRMSRAAGGGCQPHVYLDGVKVLNEITTGPPPPPPGAMRRAAPARVTQGSILETIEPESIEAIEVFTGASQIPPQYNQTGSVCGVVLVWLKRSS